ncbi:MULTISPECIES: TetR-like C-terminal domain-containing protein [Streptomyces]|uniref:TetR-like C-terminal domain-containing protein n=1 Tax=Streptomyces TaxID=1883 RepID=UPI0004BDF03B|nr:MULTISPECIES: TetR-like C-terminal domain-containing protein [unclassified Streptomyces]QHF92891.1 TetR family transcriptional regulator [Streptomyces sp. NHF165]
MTQPRPHGSVRPGGRTARTRTAVLAAVLEELEHDEFARLTVERIARRSGVHAATIRRRWQTVEGVLCDLLAERSRTTIPVPDTGAFRSDLRALAESIAAFHGVPRNEHLLSSVVAAAARDPRADTVLREAFGERLRYVSTLVQRAVERGELPPETDGEEVIAALGAPLYYRLLIVRRPLDDQLVHTAAEAAYHAAVAGVFTRA